MKRIAALLVLAIASLSSASEEKYAFTIDLQSAGTATMSYNKLPDGGSQFVVDVKLDFSGQTIHTRHEDRYDKDGRPTLTTESNEQGGTKTEEKVVFGIASLTHSTTANGKTKDRLVRYPLGKSIALPSQLWFFSKRPEANATSSEIEYNMRTGKFDRHKRVYLGPTQIDMGGKKIRAFQLQDKDLDDGSVITQWVDLQGMPYRLINESSGHSMQLDRVKS